MTPVVLATFLLLAQQQGSESRGYAVSWAIVVFGLILGLYAALSPSKRAEKVTKPKKE